MLEWGPARLTTPLKNNSKSSLQFPSHIHILKPRSCLWLKFSNFAQKYSYINKRLKRIGIRYDDWPYSDGLKCQNLLPYIFENCSLPFSAYRLNKLFLSGLIFKFVCCILWNLQTFSIYLVSLILFQRELNTIINH